MSKPNQNDILAMMAEATEAPTETKSAPAAAGRPLSKVLNGALYQFASAACAKPNMKQAGITADMIDLHAGPTIAFYNDVVTEIAGELRNLSRAVSRALAIVEDVAPPQIGADGTVEDPSNVLDVIGDMLMVHGPKGGTAARFSLAVTGEDGKTLTTVSYRLPGGTPMGDAFKAHAAQGNTGKSAAQNSAKTRELIKGMVAGGLWTKEQGAAELAKLEFGS